MRHRLVPCLAALLVPAMGAWASDLPPMQLQPVHVPPPQSSADQLVDDVIPAYGVTHQRPYRIRSRLNDLYHRIHVFTASTEASVAAGSLALPPGSHGESPPTAAQQRVRGYLQALDEEADQHHLLNHYERWQLFTSYRNLHRINDLLTLGLGQELFAEMTKVVVEEPHQEPDSDAPQPEADEAGDAEAVTPAATDDENLDAPANDEGDEPSAPEVEDPADTDVPDDEPSAPETEEPTDSDIPDDEPSAPEVEDPADTDVPDDEPSAPETEETDTTAPDLTDVDPDEPVATEDKAIEMDGRGDEASVDHSREPVERRGPRGNTVIPWTVEPAVSTREERPTPTPEETQTDPQPDTQPPVEPTPVDPPLPPSEPTPEPDTPTPPSDPEPEPETPAPPVEDEPVEEDDGAEEEEAAPPQRPAPPPPALDEDALLDDLPPLD